MRILRDEKGQLTVWLILIFPVLIILFTFFVNAIVIVDAKIRLQAAVDRAAYAGAAYLAHVMDEVARLDWKFRKEYRDKESAFDMASNENKDWIEGQVKELYQDQDKLYGWMNELLESGYGKAHEIARGVANKNLEMMPHLAAFGYVPLYGEEGKEMYRMINDLSETGEYLNKRKLYPAEIKGVAYDPDNYQHHEYTVHTYLVKDESYYVAIASGLEAHIRPPLLPDFFTSSGTVRFRVAAAAQPYGGSAKAFALIDMESLEAAESSPAGQNLLYHPATVPVKIVREDIDVLH